MIGRVISNYKILEKIGEGGMGVVYKAEDTKLKRIVAIKFLPAELTSNVEAKERFINEARAISTLDHPNICTIYEINETTDGHLFIVLAYYSGKTLKSRLKEQGLKVDETLDLGIQMLEGIKAAHKKDIIHRDIKSSNLMLTDDNLIKIVDFGLAKLANQTGIPFDSTTAGTTAYMSPEQVQRMDLKKSSDIWSFGIVLYEAAAGELPFKGEYEQAITYSILNEEPVSVRKIRRTIPKDFEKIIFKCIEKDISKRYQTAEEVLADLKKLKADIERKKKLDEEKSRKLKKRRILNLLAIVAASILFYWSAKNVLFKSKELDPKVVQTQALTTSASVFEIDPNISPDGTRIVYVSDEQGNMDVWLQQIASGQKRNLTEDHEGYDGTPIWSPDGNWIAFISSRDGDGIYKVSEYGGIATKVVSQKNLRAISWSPDGLKISFSANGDLFIVPVESGTPVKIDLPGNCLDQSWAPDGKHIIYTTGEYSRRQIWVKRLDDSPPASVLEEAGSFYTPLWLELGNKIFFKWNRSGTRDIWWVDVDKDGSPTDVPKPLTSGLDTYDFSLSTDLKKIAYSRGGQHFNIFSIPIVKDRVFTVEHANQITSENQWMRHLALSPDHKQFAFTAIRSGIPSIWIVDRDGQNMRKLTPENINAWSPAWSPDGETIAFHTDLKNNHDIYTISTSGGPLTQITDNPSLDDFPSWSQDGSQIAYFSDRSGNFDIWVSSLAESTSLQLTTNEAEDRYANYSRNNKHISFTSNRSGSWELYLTSAGHKQVKQLTHINSADVIGHTWSVDNKSIYFTYDPGIEDPGRKIYAVDVATGSIRKIVDFKGPNIQGEPLRSLATDGKYIYFIKQYHASDIWLGEISY